MITISKSGWWAWCKAIIQQSAAAHWAVCALLVTLGNSVRERRVAEHTEMAVKREETMKTAVVTMKLCREPFKLLNYHIYFHTSVLQCPGCAALDTHGDKVWRATTAMLTLGWLCEDEGALGSLGGAAAQGWESALLFQGNGVKHFLQSTEQINLCVELPPPRGLFK